jgi:hypothetical protein
MRSGRFRIRAVVGLRERKGGFGVGLTSVRVFSTSDQDGEDVGTPTPVRGARAGLRDF